MFQKCQGQEKPEKGWGTILHERNPRNKFPACSCPELGEQSSYIKHILEQWKKSIYYVD